jgi:DNA-directed RNA polymerase subunit RPC12/RpoP
MKNKLSSTSIVPPEIIGGSNHYLCLACKHRFTSLLPIGLFCPKCKSLRVVRDEFIKY